MIKESVRFILLMMASLLFISCGEYGVAFYDGPYYHHNYQVVERPHIIYHQPIRPIQPPMQRRHFVPQQHNFRR